MVNDAFEHDIERDANTTIELAEQRLFTLAESRQKAALFRLMILSVPPLRRKPVKPKAM
jgi:hypothetical protein